MVGHECQRDGEVVIAETQSHGQLTESPGEMSDLAEQVASASEERTPDEDTPRPAQVPAHDDFGDRLRVVPDELTRPGPCAQLFERLRSARQGGGYARPQ